MRLTVCRLLIVFMGSGLLVPHLLSAKASQLPTMQGGVARPLEPGAGLTIPELRARSYGGGKISIGKVYRRGSGYTSYRISYPADGLRLT